MALKPLPRPPCMRSQSSCYGCMHELSSQLRDKQQGRSRALMSLHMLAKCEWASSWKKLLNNPGARGLVERWPDTVSTRDGTGRD